MTSQLNSLAEAFVLVSNRDSGSKKRRESQGRKERLRRFTAEEYADYVGLARRTGNDHVRQMVKQGKAPSIRLDKLERSATQ